MPANSPDNAAKRTPFLCRHALLVPLLLAVGAALAVTSLLGDSLTFDELNHLTAGVSYLETGDFRLDPATPPLGQMWQALPLLAIKHDWPGAESPHWVASRRYFLGRQWLFQNNNSQAETLHNAARIMTVLLYLGTCLTVYALGRSMFGRAAGLLALTLAVFSPTLLAHGRLVTADLPVTFATALSLLTFGLLMREFSWPRLLGACIAISLAATIKMSWPLILPALGIMALIAMARRTPLRHALWPTRKPAHKSRKPSPAEPIVCEKPGCGQENAAWAEFCVQCGAMLSAQRDPPAFDVITPAALKSRLARGVAILFAGAVMATAAWAAIWTCFAWRYSPFPPGTPEHHIMRPVKIAGQPAAVTMDGVWDAVLRDAEGKEMTGLAPKFITWARQRRFLPEAYLYGLALVVRPSQQRTHYLNGEIYSTIKPSYFPIAFALKTPIATLLLLLSGLVTAAAHRPSRTLQPMLLIGVIFFAAAYFAYTSFNVVNIGHRHILPIYPALFALAGATGVWWGSRLGRIVLLGAVGWLVAANALIYPHYLSYFNESIGGPTNGHHYLADSNIDWGQDLKRLAKYAERHPDEKIKLAYFGSADPSVYGLEYEKIPRRRNFGKPSEQLPGTYVISITELLGIYPSGRQFRSDRWKDGSNALKEYKARIRILSKPLSANANARKQRQRRQVEQQHAALAQARLLARLPVREPDDRIGMSLMVYRLTAEDVAELIKP